MYIATASPTQSKRQKNDISRAGAMRPAIAKHEHMCGPTRLCRKNEWPFVLAFGWLTPYINKRRTENQLPQRTNPNGLLHDS